MPEKYPYQKNWKDYRGRRYIKFFFWIVYCILLFYLYFSGISLKQKGVFALILICGFIAIELYVSAFKCPRCGHNFFWKRNWFNFKTWNECQNCKLKLYEGSTYKWTLIG